MKNGKLLRYDDVTWNISGLFVHDVPVLFFYDLLEKCGVKLKMAVHGNMPCKWNSGRIIKSVSEEYQKWCLEQYAARNIPVILTFSNYFLTEDDLNDRPSNRILDWIAAYKGNGVLVSSPILMKYVRQKYPDLLICSSILKAVHDRGKGKADYYNKLSEQFDRIVLHPDDGFNISLLENLEQKEKVEILINENCVRNCQFREEHCDIVCEYYQKERPENCFEKLNDFKRQKCQSIQDIQGIAEFVQGKKSTCNMSRDELKRVYECGYRSFKIQGRSLSAASLLYDLTRYTLQEEPAGTIFKMIMDRLYAASLEGQDSLMNIWSDTWERI